MDYLLPLVTHFDPFSDPQRAAAFRFFTTTDTETALYHAGYSYYQNEQGQLKKDPHQYRLSNDLLREAGEHVLARKEQILRAKNFAELMAQMEYIGSTTSGLGKLWEYDAALRIAWHLGEKWYPELIYIHQGAARGAAKLGLDTNRRYILKSEFPEVMQKLEPWEIEIFLCEEKGKFL